MYKTWRKKIMALALTLLVSVAVMTGCLGMSAKPYGAQASVKKGIRTAPSSETVLDVPDSELCLFESKEVFCEREGNRIFGVLYTPQDEKRTHPALIIAHGYGGSYRDGVRYAEMLAQRGFVVYCFDFCGGSTTSLSEGSVLEMSFFTEQEDLEAVLTMMQSQSCVDPDNIFLMGISQGGAISAMTAADRADEIKGLILFFPAFNLVDEITNMFNSPESIPDRFDFLWMEVGRPYGDIWGYDIYDAVSSYNHEVLILHGDEDSIVPISYSEEAAEVYPDAELVVIPGANHGFSGDDSDTAFEIMVGYMLCQIESA